MSSSLHDCFNSAFTAVQIPLQKMPLCFLASMVSDTICNLDRTSMGPPWCHKHQQQSRSGRHNTAHPVMELADSALVDHDPGRGAASGAVVPRGGGAGSLIAGRKTMNNANPKSARPVVDTRCTRLMYSGLYGDFQDSTGLNRITRMGRDGAGRSAERVAHPEGKRRRTR